MTTELSTSPPATQNSARAALFIAVVAVHVIAAAVVRTNGWDDGAITVAFAQTFADTGDIALTPGSEQVEGFSSLAWFGWLSLVLWVLPLGFAGAVAASQVSAAILAGVCAVLLAQLLSDFTPARNRAAVIAGVTLVFGLFINETFNGMEMTLLTTAVLVGLLGVQRNRLWVVGAAVAAVPFIRLEATGYVAVGAVIATVLCPPLRRHASVVLATVIASAGATTLIRLGVFDALIPNTIVAKRSEPYSPVGVKADLVSRLQVVQELVYVFAPAAALLAFGVLTSQEERSGFGARVRQVRNTPLMASAVAYLVGLVLVNLVLGRNWGYLGRMELSALPVAVLVAAWLVPGVVERLGTRRVATAMLVGVLLATWAVQLDRAKLAASLHPSASMDVTPAEYRLTGIAAEHLAERLGMSRITLLTPDVGGVSLCCQRINVLDLGLLTNRRLAADGYGSIDPYVSRESPDVVETHGTWSRVSGIYQSGVFRSRYVPVSVDRTAFFVRRDLLTKQLCSATVPESATRRDRYRGAPIDEQFIAGKQVCIVD
ncbi:hypothetical protein [Gordonia sp. AC31]|uniref:hypothetical protein n=1 Tax=Gordonia sp. AC31 TaxID=2962571 RepID=UPI0028812BFD|nr:hypothetical protein [Gordonia sp. AC31]MDT0223451.1 hypothetical protein [Gordonia sp. AC31]